MGREEIKDYGPILRRGLIEHLPRLKGAPLAVYLALILEADPKTFRVAKSADQLAALTGYSSKSVKLALHYLANAKECYIVNEGADNPWSPNVYYIPKLSLRGVKTTPRNKPHSGVNTAPLSVGKKLPHGGEHSGEHSGVKTTPRLYRYLESMNEGMCASAQARARAREGSSAQEFLHHLESLTAIWPVPASKYGLPETDVDMAELEACLDLLGVDEARRLTEEAYGNAPPQEKPKWLWQFKRILQDEIRRREGNGKAKRSGIRGGRGQAESENERRTREEALAALGLRK